MCLSGHLPFDSLLLLLNTLGLAPIVQNLAYFFVFLVAENRHSVWSAVDSGFRLLLEHFDIDSECFQCLQSILLLLTKKCFEKQCGSAFVQKKKEKEEEEEEQETIDNGIVVNPFFVQFDFCCQQLINSFLVETLFVTFCAS